MSVLINLIAAGTAKVNCLQTTQCDTGLPMVAASNSSLQNLLQLLFGILAVVAVLVIVIAGFRYIVESTNPQETARARNAIVYAVIGLVIALSAEIIVSYFLENLS